MKSLGIYDTPLGISPDGQIVGWTYNSNAITVSYWKSYSATPTALTINTKGTGSNNYTMSTMGINAAGQICGGTSRRWSGLLAEPDCAPRSCFQATTPVRPTTTPPLRSTRAA